MYAQNERFFSSETLIFQFWINYLIRPFHIEYEQEYGFPLMSITNSNYVGLSCNCYPYPMKNGSHGKLCACKILLIRVPYHVLQPNKIQSSRSNSFCIQSISILKPHVLSPFNVSRLQPLNSICPNQTQNCPFSAIEADGRRIVTCPCSKCIVYCAQTIV